MTIAGRPEVKVDRREIREVTFSIPSGVWENIIIAWVKKTYPEFRPFAEGEITVDFMQDSGGLEIHGWREKSE